MVNIFSFDSLKDCHLCPRNCHVNRLENEAGYCSTDSGFHISSICVHRGEEPAVSGKNGICNVFFGHCNLQCVYCQNYQISNNRFVETKAKTLDETVKQICDLLDKGCTAVGFVSPSHQIPQMVAIIEAIRNEGRNPVFVYNTNAYDKVEVLRQLESLIDVYLPDLKYLDADLAKRFSKAADYPQVASKAIKEMYRQKGSTLRLSDEGEIESGLIIRHLVMPRKPQQSIEVLQFIAHELSPLVAISLMAQYYPTPNVLQHKELKYTVTEDEYKQVVDQLHELGFYKGWVQELESYTHYRPNFELQHPFES